MSNDITTAESVIKLPNVDVAPNELALVNQANPTHQNDAAVNTLTSMTDNYLNTAYKKFQWGAEAIELDKYTAELGLGPISKQLTIDRVKTILAGFMALQILGKIKADSLKFIAIGGVGLLVLKNKDSILNVFNKEKYIEQAVYKSEVAQAIKDAPTIVEQGMGNCNKCMGDF